MVFNSTFNNISVISWRFSFIGGGNWNTWRKQPNCRKSLTNFITYCCIEYTSPWTQFELTTLVVIGTDCIGSCKSNYHTIMTTTAPSFDCTIFINVCQLYITLRLWTRQETLYLYIFFYIYMYNCLQKQ